MSLKQICILLLNLITLGACNGSAQEMTLVNKSSSDYKIVIPKEPSKVEQHAASVLQDYVQRASGCLLPIVQEGAPVKGPAFYLGYTGKKEEIRPGKMPAESYLVQTLKQDIVICAGSGKGLVYGVYHFIEAYLHCKKLSSDPAFIPEYSGKLAIPGHIHDEYKPQFVYREVYYPASHDPEYLEWHELQQLEDLWGLWGHSFSKLVPAKTYFATNPEYYALVNGVRQPTQLCLSNEKVFKLVVADLKKRMADHPDAVYWSVSPNDDNGYCQCDLCRKTDDEYGGPSGSLIKFVNRVAAAFPDKTITTLAYGYTHKAPRNLKPADNVYVFLSDIDAFRDKSLLDDGSAAAFRTDLKAWGNITHNLFIWDYVTEFTNYLAPFPNFQTQQPNMRYLKDNNVKGIFIQGSGDTYSEWAELRSYLLAKLLEDDNSDVPQLTASFFRDYYGLAGKYMQDYLDMLTARMLGSHRKLDIYGNPVNEWNSYLTPELLDQYSGLFDKAEAVAEDHPLYLERVIRASLSLEYTVLQQARFYGIEKFGIFVKDKAGDYSIKPKFETKVAKFVANCKKARVTELSEGGLNPDQYQAEWNVIFRAGVTPSKAVGAAVTLQYPFAEDYPAKGARTLTDGNPGYNDFSYNWLCFYGTPMVATVDLGKITSFKNIRMDFLDDPRHWIFTPEKVTIEISGDGINYNAYGVTESQPLNEHYDVTIAKSAVSKQASARYIKVTALNRGSLPSWRYRENKKPMIACDEIFVQ